MRGRNENGKLEMFSNITNIIKIINQKRSDACMKGIRNKTNDVI